MEDNIKEKLITKAITLISIEKTKKIIHQMEKCACKIYINRVKGQIFHKNTI
jgi:hypothetical protein